MMNVTKNIKAKDATWKEVHEIAKGKGYENWFKWMGADRKKNTGKPVIHDESDKVWREVAKKHGVNI